MSILFGSFLLMFPFSTHDGNGTPFLDALFIIPFAVALFSGKKIGLKQRTTMKEAISAFNVGGIARLTGFIMKMTIIIELFGVVMALTFCREFGFFKGIWYALFHSISAFCNCCWSYRFSNMG